MIQYISNKFYNVTDQLYKINAQLECFGHVGPHQLHKMFYTADEGLRGRNVVCVDFVQIICYVPDRM